MVEENSEKSLRNSCETKYETHQQRRHQQQKTDFIFIFSLVSLKVTATIKRKAKKKGEKRNEFFKAIVFWHSLNACLCVFVHILLKHLFC